MELASQVVGDVVKSLMGYFMRHVGYLTSYANHIEHMENRMNHLEGTSIDVTSHMEANETSNKEVPARVQGWLDDVQKIMKDVRSISSKGHMGCLNIKGRHQAAIKALKATERIEYLISENSEIIWTDAPIPLGRVNSKWASTSGSSASGGDTQSGFKSRDKTFNDALKYLQQDNKTQVIALCGMGGVGKTTMMEQLKKVASDKKMFNWIVTVAIGRNPDMKSIQEAVAAYTGERLTETNEMLRADYLHKRFKTLSERKEKTLVILDDVWNKIELKNIGLSPLPNGVKLLLTSRQANICKQIASDLQVVQVDVLNHVEACDLFFKITEVSQHDRHLYQIGRDIVKKCGGLPLAITIIAITLKSNEKDVWSDMLYRLEKNMPSEDLQEVIDISYNYIKEEEEKMIFLLCGMFPEDSYIPIEDITRYAWGLTLLKDVSTLKEARYRTKTCVCNLVNASLLIDSDSDHRGCVKMHDLVLAFVVAKVSKGNDAWIIDHHDMSKWSEVKMIQSCKRISLSCKGGSKFPKDFKFPNLSFLKLMQGDDSLRFPDNFYREMETLQLIAYDHLEYPLLPTSVANLQTLCIHNCLLTFDLSCIGYLSNLEVLSFANSGIKKLPSTYQKLKKLRLLDLTGCESLVIEDGVLENLVMIEELYMKVGKRERGITFTDYNCKELAKISRKLCALDIELFENKAQPQNMSFQNLERFRISVGCLLDIYKQCSYDNTLKLVTNIHELLESKMNELFEKTDVLFLTVDGMNNLAHVETKSPHPSPQYSTFYNIRDLVIDNCGELEYLFTVNIATTLSKLECLRISSCFIMDSLVDIESNGAHAISFPRLKSLILDDLPKLSCLCNGGNVIELPQLVDLKLCRLPKFASIYPKNKLATSSVTSNVSTTRPLLNEEVVIPKLETMSVREMENLKEIWPYEHSTSEQVTVSTLREIKVMECVNLVNLFPCNPMPSLQHLEQLEVMTCGSIEVLFNIDVDCVREIVECNNRLTSIQVDELGKLREIWRVKCMKNPHIIISDFQAAETIRVKSCKSFRNVFTPTTCNFDLRALKNLEIDYYKDSWSNFELARIRQEQEISKEGIDDNILNVAFPSYLIHNFHHLRNLNLRKCKEVEVVFDIDSLSSKGWSTIDQQPLLLFPYLEDLELRNMEKMNHVWRCSNWNNFMIFQKQLPVSSFHNLTIIYISDCNNMECLFSSLMAKLLFNLKKVQIDGCKSIQEVVSTRDDENGERPTTSASTLAITTLFPYLESLNLYRLDNLKHIGGGGGAMGGSKIPEAGVLSWSLCQYSRKIDIMCCDALSSVIPSCAVGGMQKLENLRISSCKSLIEVFETQVMNNNSGGGSGSTNVDEGNGGTLALAGLKNFNVPQVSHLRKFDISECDLLEYVFTFSTLASLRQLEELHIHACMSMKVIVKQENGEQTMTSAADDDVVVLPCLKYVTLTYLPNLLGFFLGMNDFQWKSLEIVEIKNCPQIKVFTSGHSTAPKLNFIHTSFGKYSPDCGLNIPLTTTLHETPFPTLETTSSLSPATSTSERTPWSYHNLVELIDWQFDMCVDQKIIPSNELQHLQKLERIHLWGFTLVEEIFEVPLEGTNTTVEIPNLREVVLLQLTNLKYIWKINQGTVLEFPNLTRLHIDYCDRLKHVFSSSMIGSLLQLQDLEIFNSDNIEVIVKEEEECVARVKKIELPRLKSLRLYHLKSLKGFCIGKEAFSFPSLDTLEIWNCPKLTVFTTGHSNTPELKRAKTTFGMCDLKEDLNSFINTTLQQGLET